MLDIISGHESEFILAIIFWLVALCWGLKTCWDEQSWEPLKGGVGIFLVLYLIPFLLLWVLVSGGVAINDYFDGGLKTAFNWIMLLVFGVFLITLPFHENENWFGANDWLNKKLGKEEQGDE